MLDIGCDELCQRYSDQFQLDIFNKKTRSGIKFIFDRNFNGIKEITLESKALKSFERESFQLVEIELKDFVGHKILGTIDSRNDGICIDSNGIQLAR